jgi:hypothetical protein
MISQLIYYQPNSLQNCFNVTRHKCKVLVLEDVEVID